MKSWSWACRHASLDALVGDVRVGDREVVADRGVEQVHMLGHDAEHPPDSSARSSRTSRPPIRISPAVRSQKRSSRLTIVVLPDPLGPTMREALTVRRMVKLHLVEYRAGRSAS